MMFCCYKQLQRYIAQLESKKVRLQRLEFATFRPLVVLSLGLGATLQGLQVINSIDPKLLKCNYYLISIYTTQQCLSLMQNLMHRGIT